MVTDSSTLSATIVPANANNTRSGQAVQPQVGRHEPGQHQSSAGSRAQSQAQLNGDGHDDYGPPLRRDEVGAVLIYSMGVSVDGFIADREGGFGWTVPDEELFRFHLARVRELGCHLCGRKLYETMLV